MKNAIGIDRYERSRLTPGKPLVSQARLLSQAEYSAAEGNADIPLWAGSRDDKFDKVAASGRSAALLNTDWVVRCGYSDYFKHPPPGGFVNTAFASREAAEARVEAHAAREVQEHRRKLKKTCMKQYKNAAVRIH